MTGKIFISYRRSDSDAVAHRMFDWLVEQFGPDAVFIDIDRIPAGADWRSDIAMQVRAASVVLVVIAETWLEALHVRADDPKDVLRLEIETALAEGKPIIPVLIERTDMPGYGQLPAWAARLPDFNAARVSKTNDFRVHMERLGTQLAEGFGFKRVVLVGAATKPRPSTADLVVSSPYAGPAVPPPKAGERWEKVELPAKLQKLWSRPREESGWGETRAAWNNDVKYPVLGFCNRGKVGFLKFPGANFTYRLLFDNPFANYKEYWQFPICFDWNYLGAGEVFVFASESGVGIADSSSSFLKRDWNGKDVRGDDWRNKRVFGVEGCILVIDATGVDANSSKEVVTKVNGGHTLFELSGVGRAARLSLAASRKFAVLSADTGDYAVLSFSDNMLRKHKLGAHDTAHEVEVSVISTPSNVWCSSDTSWHPTKDIFAATRYVGDEETWRIWLMDTTGKLVAPATPTDHKARSFDATELDWNSTGRFLAVASGDHSLSLWDLLTDEVRRLFGHTGPVRRVKFSPDGQRLASIGENEAIIWQPETGERIASWPASGPAEQTLRGTFWAPDARMIATTSSNGLEIRQLAI